MSFLACVVLLLCDVPPLSSSPQNETKLEPALLILNLRSSLFAIMLHRYRTPIIKQAGIVRADGCMTQCSDRRHHPAPFATTPPCIPCRHFHGGGGSGPVVGSPPGASQMTRSKSVID
jgi:hypothetical protein